MDTYLSCFQLSYPSSILVLALAVLKVKPKLHSVYSLENELAGIKIAFSR